MSKIDNLSKYVSQAISHYWRTRQTQSQKQAKSGRLDQGARSAVTGGAQMDGFIDLISDLIIEAGAGESNIFYNKNLELPGFFRPTKRMGSPSGKGQPAHTCPGSQIASRPVIRQQFQ